MEDGLLQDGLMPLIEEMQSLQNFCDKVILTTDTLEDSVKNLKIANLEKVEKEFLNKY